MRNIQKLADDYKAYNPQVWLILSPELTNNVASDVFFKLFSHNLKIQLELNDVILKPDIIGSLISNYDYLLVSEKKKIHQNIVDRVKAEKYDFMQAKGIVYDMCSLSNDFMVVTFGKHVAIYDQNFQIVKQTETLNGKGFFCGSLTLDNQNFLYIVDCKHHKIIKTDLNFKGKLFGLLREIESSFK